MHLSKIPDNQRSILKALLSVDNRIAAEIAFAAGTSRPTVVNTIAGSRGISNEFLSRIISVLGLTPAWRLDPGRVHLWKVGPDTSAIVEVVNTLYESARIWDLNYGRDTDNSIGYYLISEGDSNIQHAPPYAFVFRDRFLTGRGIRRTVEPKDARPFTDELFENAKWMFNGATALAAFDGTGEQATARLKRIFAGEESIALADIDWFLNPTSEQKREPSWDDVIKAATERRISPSELIKWISQGPL